MDTIIRRWSQSPNWIRISAILALPTAGCLTVRIVEDYKGWLRMGRGGAPYNFGGYLLTVAAEILLGSRDTKSLAKYDHPERYCKGWDQASEQEKSNAERSFLETSLPRRQGPEAHAIPYNIPQREKNFGEDVDLELKEAYTQALDSLAVAHASSVEWKTSVLEKYDRALFLQQTYTIPTLVAPCRGEIGHVHDSDISGHVALSFADAKEVVSNGWGERHRMSGSKIIPLGYTMVYQPRNMEEIEVLTRIFEAGVRYAESNGRKNDGAPRGLFMNQIK